MNEVQLTFKKKSKFELGLFGVQTAWRAYRWFKKSTEDKNISDRISPALFDKVVSPAIFDLTDGKVNAIWTITHDLEVNTPEKFSWWKIAGIAYDLIMSAKDWYDKSYKDGELSMGEVESFVNHIVFKTLEKVIGRYHFKFQLKSVTKYAKNNKDY